MRAVIYGRSSVQDGGLDDQIETCRAYARRRCYSVRKELRDVASGATLERPGLDELIKTIKRDHVAVVIVFSRDRLARSALLLETLRARIEQAGAAIEFVEDVETGLASLAYGDPRHDPYTCAVLEHNEEEQEHEQ